MQDNPTEGSGDGILHNNDFNEIGLPFDRSGNNNHTESAVGGTNAAGKPGTE